MHFQNVQYFLSFSLTWDPMGAKISKRYSSLKSLLKTFLNFLLSGPYKHQCSRSLSDHLAHL